MKNTNVIPIQKIPSMLENDYQFVDLRDPYEYKKIHLTKFTNIPYEKFNLNQYHFSKKEPLILICYSGAKSKKLADDLWWVLFYFASKDIKKLTGVYSLIQWFIIKTSYKVFNFSYRNNNLWISFL